MPTPSQDNRRLIHDLENRKDPSAKQPKIIYAGDQYDGQPFLIVSEEDIALVGDKKNVISVNPTFGVLLGGRVSISSLPDQTSYGGGFWRVNPLVLSTVPSTTPTPVPWLVKDTPELLKAKKDVKSSVNYIERFFGF